MAKIGDLLQAGQTFSFEFFPPKDDTEHALLAQTLFELQPLHPSFVSVTYRGGRSSRRRTHDLVVGMLRTTTLTPMAHLICAGHSRLELAEILVELRQQGVENLMALGGDPPTDDDAPPHELDYALQLVELARAIGGFSIGVAAHPSVHPRSPDRAADRDRLAEKLALADFAVTQAFFSFEEYTQLVDDLAERGLHKPVVPGIMPITSLGTVRRLTQLGAVVPPELEQRLLAASAVEGGVRAAGIEATTELCRALLDVGAPGLHFFTLNRSSATRELYVNLGLDAPAAAP